MWQRQLKQHMTRRYPMKIHKANWFQKGFSRWVAKRNEAGKEICRHVRHPWWTNPVFVGYLIPIQGAENPVELSNNLGFPSYDSSACIIFSGYICKDIAILYTSGPTMTWHTRFYCLKWKLRVVTMAHFSMILAHSARLKRHEGTNAEFHTEINGEISSRISPGTTYNTMISQVEAKLLKRSTSWSSWWMEPQWLKQTAQYNKQQTIYGCLKI